MSLSAHDLLTLLGAVALAGIGGELFLKGVLGAAASLRVPKLLVATSLAAFATSSPELTVVAVAASCCLRYMPFSLRRPWLPDARPDHLHVPKS